MVRSLVVCVSALVVVGACGSSSHHSEDAATSDGGGDGGGGGSAGTPGTYLHAPMPDSVTAYCLDGTLGVVACSKPIPNLETQDGKIVAPPASYQASGMVVHDLVTDLRWRYVPLQISDFASVQAACQALTDDNRGWRLPTAPELISIVDYLGEQLPPQFAAWGHSPTGWTITPGLSTGFNRIVETAGGRVRAAQKDLSGAAEAICVSGSGTTVPEPRFVAGPDAGSVLDRWNNLMWEYGTATNGARGPASWDAASAACDSFGGGGGRLPTVKELASLEDFGAPNGVNPYAPEVDVEPSAFYWTSTPHPGGAQSPSVWIAKARDLAFDGYSPTAVHYLCVR